MHLKNKLIFFFAVSLVLISCKDESVEPEPTEEQNFTVIPEFYSSQGLEPTFQLIAKGSNRVRKPKDLDFQKVEGRKGELWVMNYGTENSGGSTVTISNAGKTNQTEEYRQDGNAWHFMVLPTAIAFSENGDWGTSSGILDANRRGVNFTGPSMWPGDMSIYAQVGFPPTSQINGSHLDMVHQSPLAMGMCAVQGNEYFVFDGFHGNLTYYDFGIGHPPGGHDHSDASVIHYPEVELKRDPTGYLVGHMEMDAERKWLYVVDTDRQRVLKVNTKSGTNQRGSSIAQMHGEPLQFYGEKKGVEWKVLAKDNLQKPCGLAINENRLFISDNETNEIICFDTESGNELGRIEVQADELMGICIGPEGHLWYVDYGSSEVFKVIPSK